MIYVYLFIKCVVRRSENSVRFEKSCGNWLPDGPNSVRLYLIVCEIISHSVRDGMYGSSVPFGAKIQPHSQCKKVSSKLIDEKKFPIWNSEK